MIIKHIFTNAIIPDPAVNENDTAVDYTLVAQDLEGATQDPQFAGLTGGWCARYLSDMIPYGDAGGDLFIGLQGQDDYSTTEHVQDAEQAHPYDDKWQQAPGGIVIARAALVGPDGSAAAVIYVNIPDKTPADADEDEDALGVDWGEELHGCF